MQNEFDVIIIGGGISGSALFYTLSKYSDVKRIALVEKCNDLAKISSSAKANSQTIHDGSIETNMSFEKASKIRFAANKVRNYALNQNLQNSAIFGHQKMCVAIGEEECDFLQKRQDSFQHIFPDIKLFDKEKIKELEPKVVECQNGLDRPEKMLAVGTEFEWCAVDFSALTKSFAQNAIAHNSESKIFLNYFVKDIQKRGDAYAVISRDNEEIYAKYVLVDAGSHSLPLAQKMGYGMDLGCLPIAGNFYFVPDLLRGKVYTVQNPKLPFAAIHGDPDVRIKSRTRIGPTALVIPKLEKGKHWYNNISYELLKIDMRLDVIKIGLDLLKDSEIRNYVFKNIVFEMPFIGRKEFLKSAQKLIPSLRVGDLSYANGFGEVRPQVLDLTAKKLIMGERKIKTDGGLMFNMTPSPGATSCLENAILDANEICNFLGATLDSDRFYQELSPDEPRSNHHNAQSGENKEDDKKESRENKEEAQEQ